MTIDLPIKRDVHSGWDGGEDTCFRNSGEQRFWYFEIHDSCVRCSDCPAGSRILPGAVDFEVVSCCQL